MQLIRNHKKDFIRRSELPLVVITLYRASVFAPVHYSSIPYRTALLCEEFLSVYIILILQLKSSAKNVTGNKKQPVF